MNEQLEQIRLSINETDAQLTRLLAQRMDLVAKVAQIKEEAGLPVYDPKREAAVLDKVSALAGEEKAAYLRRVYQCLMDASKDYERVLMAPAAFPNEEEPPMPDSPKVACQGVPGAFSGQAAQRMFPNGKIVYVPTWNDTFQKVASGECDFAVLPVENSLAGSVSQVYDLLLKYRFMINRSCRLSVEQNLLTLPEAQLEDITEIYSHPQGLAQCKPFCDTIPHVRTIPLENTAAAAKMVAALGDVHKAAIASSYCAEIYGLKVLKSNIHTDEDNATRFVAVSRQHYRSLGANKISFVFSILNEPGSLCQLLSGFAQIKLNLTKMELRPIAEKDFEYDFYIDFSGDTDKPEVYRLIEQLKSSLPSVVYLGNYEEI